MPGGMGGMPGGMGGMPGGMGGAPGGMDMAAVSLLVHTSHGIGMHAHIATPYTPLMQHIYPN